MVAHNKRHCPTNHPSCKTKYFLQTHQYSQTDYKFETDLDRLLMSTRINKTIFQYTVCYAKRVHPFRMMIHIFQLSGRWTVKDKMSSLFLRSLLSAPQITYSQGNTHLDVSAFLVNTRRDIDTRHSSGNRLQRWTFRNISSVIFRASARENTPNQPQSTV